MKSAFQNLPPSILKNFHQWNRTIVGYIYIFLFRFCVEEITSDDSNSNDNIDAFDYVLVYSNSILTCSFHLMCLRRKIYTFSISDRYFEIITKYANELLPIHDAITSIQFRPVGRVYVRRQPVEIGNVVPIIFANIEPGGCEIRIDRIVSIYIGRHANVVAVLDDGTWSDMHVEITLCRTMQTQLLTPER